MRFVARRVALTFSTLAKAVSQSHVWSGDGTLAAVHGSVVGSQWSSSRGQFMRFSGCHGHSGRLICTSPVSARSYLEPPSGVNKESLYKGGGGGGKEEVKEQQNSPESSVVGKDPAVLVHHVLGEDVVPPSQAGVEGHGHLLQADLVLLEGEEALPARLVQQRLHARREHLEAPAEIRQRLPLGLGVGRRPAHEVDPVQLHVVHLEVPAVPLAVGRQLVPHVPRGLPAPAAVHVLDDALEHLPRVPAVRPPDPVAEVDQQRVPRHQPPFALLEEVEGRDGAEEAVRQQHRVQVPEGAPVGLLRLAPHRVRALAVVVPHLLEPVRQAQRVVGLGALGKGLDGVRLVDDVEAGRLPGALLLPARQGQHELPEGALDGDVLDGVKVREALLQRRAFGAAVPGEALLGLALGVVDDRLVRPAAADVGLVDLAGHVLAAQEVEVGLAAQPRRRRLGPAVHAAHEPDVLGEGHVEVRLVAEHLAALPGARHGAVGVGGPDEVAVLAEPGHEHGPQQRSGDLVVDVLDGLGHAVEEVPGPHRVLGPLRHDEVAPVEEGRQTRADARVGREVDDELLLAVVVLLKHPVHVQHADALAQVDVPVPAGDALHAEAVSQELADLGELAVPVHRAINVLVGEEVLDADELDQRRVDAPAMVVHHP
ncbi:hypothetical protein CTA1_10378 [Colletotrichum tanaceti]|uniref:Uncharacterized protein n=1 Tax=Colletotrichum tanaceti TaxID=1306861 RepID=A0A4U6XUX2_9PEZI|nr:hypothetical protein CTA1_10378 [Colletotrichum tanaceti]